MALVNLTLKTVSLSDLLAKALTLRTQLSVPLLPSGIQTSPTFANLLSTLFADFSGARHPIVIALAPCLAPFAISRVALGSLFFLLLSSGLVPILLVLFVFARVPRHLLGQIEANHAIGLAIALVVGTICGGRVAG